MRKEIVANNHTLPVSYWLRFLDFWLIPTVHTYVMYPYGSRVRFIEFSFLWFKFTIKIKTL